MADSTKATYEEGLLKKRRLPKLMACLTKQSVENMRNKELFALNVLDANGIRRQKLPLHECLMLELKENGYVDSADYLEDLIYDNIQLLSEDEIGIVVDLKTKEDYLIHIADGLQKAEKERDRDNVKQECIELLNLALEYAEKGKGIIWLAEKFFLAAIAVSSKYIVDGGRLKAICKYHYAKFLLDKFPGADPDEPFLMLTEVRDTAIGKNWMLYEATTENEVVPPDTVFGETALLLNRVLLTKARSVRNDNPSKAERMCRLAERRAADAHETSKTAESIIEIGICQLMMNNLNNAQKTFERAYKIHIDCNNIEGQCETKMHLAAVMQRLGDHETAAKLLTEMGALAMEYNLRRQLGRALHLLGELHVRREKPDLGTEHLAEAFGFFMGFRYTEPSKLVLPDKINNEDIDVICNKKSDETYIEEAEQSRFMMAISAGQERMASYFNLIKESGSCSVAQTKTMEWKLSHAGWWVKKEHHDFIPCMCPVHNRTPLDVLWIQLEIAEAGERRHRTEFESSVYLDRQDTIEDIRKLRSTISRAQN